MLLCWYTQTRLTLFLDTSNLGSSELPVLIWREPQVNLASAGLDCMFEHLPAL